jgi:hypothetical protein
MPVWVGSSEGLGRIFRRLAWVLRFSEARAGET